MKKVIIFREINSMLSYMIRYPFDVRIFTESDMSEFFYTVFPNI